MAKTPNRVGGTYGEMVIAIGCQRRRTRPMCTLLGHRRLFFAQNATNQDGFVYRIQASLFLTRHISQRYKIQDTAVTPRSDRYGMEYLQAAGPI